MIITAPNDFSGYNDKWKVFLAGPIQGAPKWQFTLPELDNIVWLCPRRNDGVELNDQTHKDQMEWETQALRASNIILFWIPEEVEHVEGRSYAQTTRFELGENLGREKRIILGVNDNFPGRDYFEYKARKYKNTIFGWQVYHTLDECIDALKIYIEMCEQQPQIYTISNIDFDENFIENSNGEYDAGDFQELPDWKKIEKWNSIVNPCDTVIHCGRFGCSWPNKYLTGKLDMRNLLNSQELKL